MTKNIKLSIPAPCIEKWENFTHTYRGGFCKSCQKEVVDFTLMSNPELIDFFSKNNASTCGRFRPNQLEISRSLNTPALTPGFGLFKAGAMALTLFLLSKTPSTQAAPIKPMMDLTAPSQSPLEINTSSNALYTVKGVVISEEDNLPLPGVNVWLLGSLVGTVTDADGKFEFPQPLNEGDVLVFSFIGLRSEEYRVRKQMNETIEIKMNLEMDIMGQVMVSEVYTEHPSSLRKAWIKFKGIF